MFLNGIEQNPFKPPANRPTSSFAMEHPLAEIADIMRFQQNLLRLVCPSEERVEPSRPAPAAAPVAEPADRIEVLYRQALARAIK